MGRLWVTCFCFIISVLGLLFSRPSRAEGEDHRPKVSIVCIFRYVPGINCNDFRDSFYSDYKDLLKREDSSTAADLELTVIDEGVSPSQIGFHFTWVSHLTSMRDSNFSYPLVLPTTLDRLALLNQLNLNALKGFSVFMKIERGTIEKDALILTFAKPDSNTPNESPDWMDRLQKSPWFINLKGGGHFSENGNSSDFMRTTNANSNLSVAYIKTRYKTDLNSSVTYSKQSLSTSSLGTYDAQSFKTYFSGIFIYTLTPPSAEGERNKGSWSVAVFNSNSTDSGSNIKNLNTTMAGVEWTLVPFRTTENRELAFRVGPEYNSLRLEVPNDLGHIREDYWRVLARIYYYWVVLDDRMTITLGATGEGNLTYKNRSSWSVNGQLSYQVTRAISVNGGVRRVFAPKPMLWYPGPGALPSNGNPLQNAFMTGQPGGQFMVNFGFAVSLGNSTKKQRDRRWAN